jgi:predicted transposase YdaD
MPKEFLLYALIAFDALILLLLILFYLKFKKLLNLPWEEIEESLDRAHRLVNRLKELKEKGGEEPEPKVFNPKEEVLILLQKGLKVKEIAKKTGLSEGEIELILKTQKGKSR